LWNVYIKPTGQSNLEGKIEQPDEIYMTVQPGLWTRDFLNRAGARSREALYQFGYLAQQVLKIDPYHNELALRLAIFLTLDSRVRLDGNYQVQELLEITLPKPVIAQIRSDFRKTYDLKQSWDSALSLLIQLGWQVQFDPQTYPEWLRPNAQQQLPKGYLDKLLDANLTIKPPVPIPELLATKVRPKIKPSQPKGKQESKPGSNLTGSQVKEAREAKGWSQAQLAGFLGVSQYLISLIERGQRPINPKLAPKICTILGIHE
jgi:DNA-binding XRE family transcriptional regulator